MIRILKYRLLAAVLCLCNYTSIAQQSKVDSLLNILQTTKEDTLKVNVLNDLFLQVEFSDNGKPAEYLNKALALSQKAGYKKGLAITYYHLGFLTEDKGNYSEALKNYFNALKIREAIADKKGISDSYNSIGIVYREQGNYPEALKNYFTCLKIREEIGFKKGIADTHNNIGSVYYNLGNYPEALKNYFAGLKMYEALGNQKGVVTCYNNMGNVYYVQGNYTEALKNYSATLSIMKEIGDQKILATAYHNVGMIYERQNNHDQALEDYSASLKIREAIGDKTGVADCHNGIGEVHFRRKEWNLALADFLAALKINLEIDNKSGVASTYGNLSKLYTKQNNLNKAEEFLIQSIKLSRQIGYKEYLSDNYKELAALDSAKNDFKGAYENHKLYIIYRDSLDNEETHKKIIQTQMTYDFEKREAVADAEHKKELENQQALANEKSRKQRTVLLFVVGGLLLVIVFAGFIFRSLRITNKQKQIIEIKNKETELQKNIIEEKHKEITDSINYAERIQRSFLATGSLLNENLKNYFVFFQPKDVVSGDFYWAGKLHNGNFALATADSTGHGVPGAIMSILNISSLEKAIELHIEPADILNHTRKTIIDRLKKDGSADGGKDGMDCSLVCFDFSNQKMTYAAANNPIWVITGNRILELKPDNMPVGKHDKDHQPFTQHEIQLQKNDVVYTLTDGLPDQFGGPKGKKFMYKQLKEILIQIHHLPMHEQKNILKNRLDEWKGSTEQVDDILLIGIRIG